MGGNKWILDKFIDAVNTLTGGRIYGTYDNQPLREINLQPICTYQRPPPGFKGRTLPLRQLRDALQTYKQSPPGIDSKPHVQVIFGKPGVGKSSLAGAFIQDSIPDLEDFYVLWIPASTKTSIRNKFVEICEAHFIGIELRDGRGNLKNDEQLMRIIYSRLTESKCLIIFDNACSGEKQFGMGEEIQSFMCFSVAPQHFLPMYILTSRVSSDVVWPEQRWTPLPLDNFTPEESWEYIKSSLPLPNIEGHRDQLMELSRFFDHLPIAVEHSVNVMGYEVENHGSAETYDPRDFIEKALKFVPHPSEELEALPESYARLNSLWDYSLRMLDRASHGAYANAILEVMSLLSSTGIPVNFLRALMTHMPEVAVATSNPSDDFAKATHLLRLFSIVSFPGDEYFIHVLLQEHKRKALSAKLQLEDHVIRVAQAMVQCKEFASFAATNHSANFANLESICEAILNFTSGPHEETKLQCAELLELCLPDVCISLLKTLLGGSSLFSILEPSGPIPEAPATSSTSTPCNPQSVELLTNCLLNTGKFDIVQALVTTYMIENATIKDSGDDTSLSILSNLAQAYYETGQLPEALEYYSSVFAFKLSRPEPLHPSTLTDESNLIIIYAALGDYQKALNLAKENYENQKKLKGPEAEATLTSLSNLAYYHSILGNYSEAIRLCQQVVDCRDRKLGTEHPDTLASYHNLAKYHHDNGDYRAALKLSTNVYDTIKDRLGEKHPLTLKSLVTMAVYYSKLGDSTKALQLTQQAYEGQCSVLGADHTDTLITKANMASYHSEKWELKEALQYCKEAYSGLLNNLGPDHPVVLEDKSNMATYYGLTGDLNTALTLAQEVVDAQSRIVGPDHPVTLNSKRNLANYLCESGQLKEAELLLQEIHLKLSASLGAEHPKTLNALNGIAGCKFQMGEIEGALSLFKQVYDVECKILGEKHPETLSSLDNVITSGVRVGDFGRAMNLYEQLVVDQSDLLGAEHPDTLTTQHNMASFYAKLGRYAQALELAEKVYDARCRVLGKEHPKTLSTWHNVATYHSELGNRELALEMSKQVHQASERVLGRRHPSTITALWCVALNEMFMDNLRRAMELTGEVYAIRVEVLGLQHPDTKETEDLLQALAFRVLEMEY